MQKTIEQLCAMLINAKQAEASANELRVGIERELLAVTGIPEEGSQTIDAEGFKIRVEQKINRKIDKKAWELIAEQIPEALRPVTIVEEYKVDGKGVRWLKEQEPGFYKLLCGAMEEKPAKPSVKVEEVK